MNNLNMNRLTIILTNIQSLVTSISALLLGFVSSSSTNHHHISSIYDGQKIYSPLLEFTIMFFPCIIFENWNSFTSFMILIAASSKNVNFTRSGNWHRVPNLKNYIRLVFHEDSQKLGIRFSVVPSISLRVYTGCTQCAALFRCLS